MGALFVVPQNPVLFFLHFFFCIYAMVTVRINNYLYNIELKKISPGRYLIFNVCEQAIKIKKRWILKTFILYYNYVVIACVARLCTAQC